jgi:hypothetical protein
VAREGYPQVFFVRVIIKGVAGLRLQKKEKE